MRLAPTPAQTIGPFFGRALPYPDSNHLVTPGRPDAVRLHGRVLDGQGAPVTDALVELWQAGPDGVVVQEPGSLRRDGWTFTGWGRSATDDAGTYSFTTLTPGTRGPDRAAFFCLTIFARGLLDRLFTRAYVPDAACDGDAFLATVPPVRRRTLVAHRDENGYRFDVRLQGEDETVFLTYPDHV